MTTKKRRSGAGTAAITTRRHRHPADHAATPPPRDRRGLAVVPEPAPEPEPEVTPPAPDPAPGASIETPAHRSTRIFNYASELARKALLEQHVKKTMMLARRALDRGDADAALKILAESAERWERYGGKPDPNWQPKVASEVQEG